MPYSIHYVAPKCLIGATPNCVQANEASSEIKMLHQRKHRRVSDMKNYFHALNAVNFQKKAPDKIVLSKDRTNKISSITARYQAEDLAQVSSNSKKFNETNREKKFCNNLKQRRVSDMVSHFESSQDSANVKQAASVLKGTTSINAGKSQRQTVSEASKHNEQASDRGYPRCITQPVSDKINGYHKGYQSSYKINHITKNRFNALKN